MDHPFTFRWEQSVSGLPKTQNHCLKEMCVGWGLHDSMTSLTTMSKFELLIFKDDFPNVDVVLCWSALLKTVLWKTRLLMR